jgi:hypothetical protein
VDIRLVLLGSLGQRRVQRSRHPVDFSVVPAFEVVADGGFDLACDHAVDLCSLYQPS